MIPSPLIPHLLHEEGERLDPYPDSKGYWTIGVGHLIDRRKGGYIPEWIRSFPITEAQSRRLLAEDLDELDVYLNRYLPWMADLSSIRATVLYSMAFQMGISGLLSFKNTLRHVRRGEYTSAASEMLNSLWARQTPARASRLATAMRTDILHF